ncbi:acetylcholine receptor subunit beta-like 1 [Symsagittifera roscoffensis]|uniref:acetylcholine receptor subunit beta-like 1 n=1 Tax=Symsagittifera roscoffensis TaxID=84072 RepID=UPI00307C969B
MSNSRARGAVNYPEVEEKLLSLIRAKTPRLIKPNLSALGPVTVVATVKQIIGLNERKGTWKAKISFRVNYAFNLSAYESPLLWSLEDFGGIECLMVPEDTFWYPSLTIENIVDPSFNIKPTKNIIWNNGWVVSERLVLMPEMSCSFDVSKFPFDQQTCSVVIVPQIDTRLKRYYGYDLQNKSGGSQDDLFTKDEQWKLISVTASGSYQRDRVIVSVQLKRRPLHYTFVIVLPTIVIYILSGLSFLLPSDACEKISFAVTILLAQVVAFSALSDVLPPSSVHPPYLLKFLVRVLGHMGALCLVTVLGK